jgi:inosine-uridine nucleoside N-ribohydrolase
MGGEIAVSRNVRAVAVFHILVDLHAADIVFKAGLPMATVKIRIGSLADRSSGSHW